MLRSFCHDQFKICINSPQKTGLTFSVSCAVVGCGVSSIDTCYMACATAYIIQRKIQKFYWLLGRQLVYKKMFKKLKYEGYPESKFRWAIK